ncbi:MAG: serine/threonine-protein kinase [Pyrinomonadaceae bacterium]
MDPERWQKVKAIFYPALELPAGERLDFVRGKCGDDRDLLSEIEALLSSHEEDQTFIEKPALHAVSDFVTERNQPSRIGEQIGAYRIERQIGRGGMGAVYLARRDDLAFEKKVAVKLIKRGLDTDEIIRRFQNERQILAALDHPNITRLLDGGATSDGLPFLVMDFVEGRPLTKYCDQNNLSINERLRLFLQICSAVRYAHQNLIIHRDLKPSNVLVTSEGIPKLLDFGIAKLISSDGVGDDTRSQTWTRVMTPEYASPEQVQGLPITTASDVYSLGVILYELLTGERPFRIKSRSADEISRIITDSQPLKPSSVVRAKFDPEDPRSKIQNPKLLRGDLDNIVLMAMRKEPERRYSSVEQFAGDLERYLGGLPVLAQEDRFGYRARKFIGRNKTGVAAGVGVAFSLIAGIISTSRQSRIAKKERDSARREADKAERINQFLQKTLSSADPSEHGKDTTVLEALRFASEQIETEFADQPEIIADLRTTIGRTYLNLGQAEKAEPHLIEAWRIRSRVLRENAEDLADSLNHLGLLYRIKGDFERGEPLFYKSLEMLRRLYGEKHLKIAEVLGNLGLLLLYQGRHQEAVETYRREKAIRTDLSGPDHPSTARTISRLADCFGIMGDYKGTEKLYRQALKIIRKQYPKTHPDAIESAAGLASALLRTDQKEAEELLFDILRTKESVFGKENPQYAWTLYNLAFLMNNQRRFAEGEKFAAEILALRKTHINDEHPVISAGLQMVAIALMGTGRAERAEALLRESLALRQKTLSADHWILDTSKSILGECLAQIGKNAEAGQFLYHSYENLRKKLGSEHEQTRNALKRIEQFEEKKTAGFFKRKPFF